MNMRAIAVSALCLASLPIAGAAQAATAFIDGNIYWGAGTATTDFSKTGSVASFSFDVDSPTASNPTSVTNFQYSLNNVSVTDPLSYVTFSPTAQDGGFDLVFASKTVSIFSDDIGSSGTIGPSGYYAATAGLAGSYPGTGVGGIVVNSGVSPVPLPAALPLLGTAIAGLGLLARRRKNSIA